jgi:hypothetical protein
MDFDRVPTPAMYKELVSHLNTLFPNWDDLADIRPDERRRKKMIDLIWKMVLLCHQYGKWINKIGMLTITWREKKSLELHKWYCCYDKILDDDYEIDLDHINHLNWDERTKQYLPAQRGLPPGLFYLH